MAPTCEYCSRLIYVKMDAHLLTCTANPEKRAAPAFTSVPSSNWSTSRPNIGVHNHSSNRPAESEAFVGLSSFDDISQDTNLLASKNSDNTRISSRFTNLSSTTVYQGDIVARDPNKSTSNNKTSRADLMKAMTDQLFASTAWRSASSDSIRNDLYDGMKQNVNYGMNDALILENLSNPVRPGSITTSQSIQGISSLIDTSNRRILMTGPRQVMNSNASGTQRSIQEQGDDEDVSDSVDNNNDHNDFYHHGDADNDLVPGSRASTQEMLTVMEKHRTPHGVLFNPRHLAALELHHMLAHVNVPKYLFDKIYKWAFRHNITRAYAHQSLVKDLKDIIQIPDIEPEVISLVISEDYSVDIVKYDFLNQFYSLLMDTELMRPENLIFGDDPLLGPIWNRTSPLGDVNTCYWYYKTYLKLCTDPLLHMICPIILFEDETFLDPKGHLKLHPASFTLGIFTREQRRKPESWRHLGFIPKALARCPPGANIDADVRRLKLVDHHRFLGDILQSLKDAQSRGPIEWKFGDTIVQMFLPLMFSIGDIAGQDKLCCRYASHSTKCSSTMRDCTVSTENAANPDFLCNFIKMSTISELGQVAVSSTATPEAVAGAKSTLKKMSFHYGVRNAFEGICFGYNPRGINGAVPPCLMHSYKARFPKDATAGYFDLFGTSDITIAKLKAETLIPQFIRGCYRQSSRDFPNLNNFSVKIVKIKQLTINEMYAQSFAIYLFSLTTLGSVIMPARARDEKMRKMILLIERTLTIYSWLNQESFPKIHVTPTQPGQFSAIGCGVLREFQNLYTELLGTDSGCKSPKFHSLLHYMWYVYFFGSAKNTHGEHCETHLKINCKLHARATQHRPGSIHLQTARNCSEMIILQRASVLANIAAITGTETVVQDDGFDSDDSEDSFEGVADDGEMRIRSRTETNSRYEIGQKSSRYYLHRGIPGVERRRIKWKKGNVPPTKSFNDDVVAKVFGMIFHVTRGVADTETVIPGFTCLKLRGHVFRAHPCYRSGDQWFDHVYLKWVESGTKCPARIEMFIDLRGTVLKPESTLTSALYAVVTSVEDSIIHGRNTGLPTAEAKNKQDRLNHSPNKPLRLCTFWQYEKKVRLVSVKIFTSPAFVIPDVIDEHLNRNNYCIEILPWSQWHEIHNEI